MIVDWFCSHFAYCANDQSGLLDENEEDPLQGCDMDDEDVTSSAPSLEHPSGSRCTMPPPKRRGRAPNAAGSVAAVKVEAAMDTSPPRIASYGGAVQDDPAGPAAAVGDKRKQGRPPKNGTETLRKTRAKGRAEAKAKGEDGKGKLRRTFPVRTNNSVQRLVLEEGSTTRRFRCRCKDLIVGDGALLQHWRDKHLAAGAVLDPSTISAYELNDEVARYALGLPRQTLSKEYLVPGGFRCPVCSKVIAKPQRLATHLPHHLDQPPENYVCSICPERVAYFEYSGLWHHYRYHHRNEYPYRCDFCNKGFKLRALLKSHMKQNHQDNIM
ncbi:hypothetical protein FOCC_FOCC005485 [Frankliniella occidentalis]|nr:hypothetical protein FOCC_FOCC005485 [Frankliniella occidentalis]